MNILVFNGSPRGENSNTLRITKSFLAGMELFHQNYIDVVTVNQAHIEPCRGCFACWDKTPGKCVIRDDMQGILEKIIAADLVIWSFPLYYFGMPSKIKGLMDRMLPLNLPWIEERSDGSPRHPGRYDMSGKQYVLISTCGFYTKENNYDALLEQFRLLYGEKGYTTILCPEGELFRVPQLTAKIEEYLDTVKKAGFEFAETGAFSEHTNQRLEQTFYPPEAFIAMANASWDVNEQVPAPVEASGRGLKLMRQMAAVYRPPDKYEKDVVLEFYFTDLHESYQLRLGKENCEVRTESFTPYTTRIETSFAVWTEISKGKISGPQAIMEHKYRVTGDFDTILKMEEYFGQNKNSAPENKTERRKTSMTLLIMPWLMIWIFIPISPLSGGIIGILSCTFLVLAGNKWELTVYDRFSIAAVTVISLFSILGGYQKLLVTLSYALFGIMWTASGLRPVPLTAYYSKEGYGGEKAYKNPLFIKTNRILTLCWGVLYLLTTIWTYFLLGTILAPWAGLLNSTGPALLGGFTAWFQKWYPAKIARSLIKEQI